MFPRYGEKRLTAPLIEVETVDHWVVHFERFDIDGFKELRQEGSLHNVERTFLDNTT